MTRVGVMLVDACPELSGDSKDVGFFTAAALQQLIDNPTLAQLSWHIYT
jgi:hypothetical protein